MNNVFGRDDDETRKLKLHAVFQMFLRGQTIEIDGVTYGMSEDFDILFRTYRQKVGEEAEKEPIWCKSGITLKPVMELLDNITEKEYVLLCANNTLNTSAEVKARRREQRVEEKQ